MSVAPLFSIGQRTCVPVTQQRPSERGGGAPSTDPGSLSPSAEVGISDVVVTGSSAPTPVRQPAQATSDWAASQSRARGSEVIAGWCMAGRGVGLREGQRAPTPHP